MTLTPYFDLSPFIYCTPHQVDQVQIQQFGHLREFHWVGSTHRLKVIIQVTLTLHLRIKS
jgi:hypothetical protein